MSVIGAPLRLNDLPVPGMGRTKIRFMNRYFWIDGFGAQYGGDRRAKRRLICSPYQSTSV